MLHPLGLPTLRLRTIFELLGSTIRVLCEVLAFPKYELGPWKHKYRRRPRSKVRGSIFDITDSITASPSINPQSDCPTSQPFIDFLNTDFGMLKSTLAILLVAAHAVAVLALKVEVKASKDAKDTLKTFTLDGEKEDITLAITAAKGKIGCTVHGDPTKASILVTLEGHKEKYWKMDARDIETVMTGAVKHNKEERAKAGNGKKHGSR
ncbi:hypothetical protein ANO11243_062340 [Dothideomycetidae sp. 11243]|nr:hypothetical protein ANO11243_062340 [fungal sp. No.11243]